jgi:hypothetical protein
MRHAIRVHSHNTITCSDHQDMGSIHCATCCRQSEWGGHVFKTECYLLQVLFMCCFPSLGWSQSWIVQFEAHSTNQSTNNCTQDGIYQWVEHSTEEQYIYSILPKVATTYKQDAGNATWSCEQFAVKWNLHLEHTSYSNSLSEQYTSLQDEAMPKQLPPQKSK